MNNQSIRDLLRNPKVLAGLGISAATGLALYYLYTRQRCQKTPAPYKAENIEEFLTLNKFREPRKLEKYLFHEQANERSEIILKKSISYEVSISLQTGPRYEGCVTIDFTLANVSAILDPYILVDFQGDSVSQLIINGTQISNITEDIYNKKFVLLPVNKLKKGPNKVIIYFENAYSTAGHGLVRFEDTDKKVYVYTQLEPYAANQVFPCFDQPDLKGFLKLQVIAPQSWRVISNEAEIHTHNVDSFSQQDYQYEGTSELHAKFLIKTAQDRALKNNTTEHDKLIYFRSTPLLPSYLFTIIGGPYEEVKSGGLPGGIPMSLFCRSSLYDYLVNDAEEILEITRHSLEFYNEFFGCPYPFSKLDYIFCPEFSSLAMENAGAITYSDNYVYRENVVKDKRVDRCNTITHELAHMWFGDMTTMTWWNDLWLNESFAEYISHLCIYKIQSKLTLLDVSNIWLLFFTRKGWGYTTDQLPTTHSIAGNVKHTEEAENIFDGITYAKGAATLKQLLCLIGEDKFSQAMKIYFQRFAWSNATLDDLLSCMSEVCQGSIDIQNNPHLDLQLWKQDWLCTPSLNELTFEWDPNTLATNPTIIAKQTYVNDKFQTLRYHKMKIALINSNCEITHVQDIIINKSESTTITLTKYDDVQAIISNYQDEAYIKIQPDIHTLKFIKANLFRIPDPLTRTMTWRTLWEMVRDAKLSSIEFFEIFSLNVKNESDKTIFNEIWEYIHACHLHYIPSDIDSKHQISNKLFQIALEILQSDKGQNEEFQILLKKNLIEFARSEQDIQFLAKWYNGEIPELSNIQPGIEDKWEIIANIFRSTVYTQEQKYEFLNKQAESDKTEKAIYYRKQCEAIIADDTQREALWKYFIDPNVQDTATVISYAMLGFNDRTNVNRNSLYYQKYFSELENIFVNRPRDYSRKFFMYLLPAHENLQETIQSFTQLRTQLPTNLFQLTKQIDEQIDRTQRKLRVHLFVRSTDTS